MLRKDHMRYLNAPFCINVMSGGQYGKKRNIRFGGIGGEKRFVTGRDTSGDSIDGNMIFPDEWGIKMHQHDYYGPGIGIAGKMGQKPQVSYPVINATTGRMFPENAKVKALSVLKSWTTL